MILGLTSDSNILLHYEHKKVLTKYPPTIPVRCFSSPTLAVAFPFIMYSCYYL